MEENFILKNDETLDDLQANGYKIIQSNKHFKFSIDAVLLSHFASFKPNDIVLDMCSGTGVVALLVCAHNNVKKIDCIEIQKELYDMCIRSVNYNKLKDKIFPYNMDLRNAPKMLGYEIYDAILCNPPTSLYRRENPALAKKKIARFEVHGNLNDIVRTSSKLLKNTGKLVLSHRAEKLSDIINSMKTNNIEPKRIRFIHSKINKKANIILIEGVKNAKPNMIIEPPLVVYDENNYMDTIYKIYNMDIQT